MTYDEALDEVRRKGLGRCSDDAAMASFRDGALQTLVGAVSPRLVWEGAREQEMTSLQLSTMAARDPMQVYELQWHEKEY